MIPQRIVMASAVGGVVGGSVVPLMRQYVDKTYADKGTIYGGKELKGFSSPSALTGIITGAGALIAGGVGATKATRYFRRDDVNAGLISYGAPSLMEGIFSGLYPTADYQAALATDPGNPVRHISVSNQPARIVASNKSPVAISASSAAPSKENSSVIL